MPGELVFAPRNGSVHVVQQQKDENGNGDVLPSVLESSDVSF